MSIRTVGKNFELALKKPFAKTFGLVRDTASIFCRKDNNFAEEWMKADGVGYVEGVRVDSGNAVHLGGSPIVQPMARAINFFAVANGSVVTTPFHVFTANAYGRVVAIYESHTTAGNDSGAVTAQIIKDRGTQSVGGGVALMSSTFNLKGTANVRQTATLSDNESDLSFRPGDRLTFKLTGTATASAGVRVTVYVQYTTNIFETSVYLPSGNQDQCFFIANRKYIVNAISYMHKTKEATTTSLKVQVVKDSSTNAPGAGTDILTNNSNGGFSATAANNTVQVGTFSAVSLAAGDRLAVDYSGTANELTFILVTVAFNAQPNRQEITAFWYGAAATDFGYWIAERDYELYDARQLHAVAAGGTSTATITKDAEAGAAGAGTSLLTTVWNLNATANTVQVLDPVTVKATIQLNDGDRLGWKFNQAIQSTAGICTTISLLAR